MAKKIDVPALSKAARLGVKAQATDNTVRAIAEAEAAKRDAKTMRLRAARLEAEASAPVKAEIEKPKRSGKR